jgi:hypothetical protein
LKFKNLKKLKGVPKNLKIKKYIGKSINGFIIKDTYVKMTPNNKKARKMLLECENCGRVFERASGANFEHIKCKCMCAPEPEHRKLIEYNGKLYMKKELAKKAGVSPHVLNYRLNKGMSIEQAMQNEWEYQCVECSKWFILDDCLPPLQEWTSKKFEYQVDDTRKKRIQQLVKDIYQGLKKEGL